jgi:tetratricopeptide (TPR) repeat protein
LTSQVANPAVSRNERRKKFAETVALIRDDPHDVRARLSVIELLQDEGRTDEAVEEMMRVAAVYARRGVPIKAVAVMRTAVKLRPERADVRMAYGEVFEKLKMVDDAAREFRAAWDLYLVQNDVGNGLEALGHLLGLDPDFVPGHVVFAEALGRAGRNQQAARVFRSLAEHLMSRGAAADWEKVAERAVFFDPSDVTLAHDLALHYARTNRHAAALGKLIVCYEVEPNDGELIELIVGVLDALGQPERAASLMRMQLGRYRRAGLLKAAEAALERLSELDPDEPEARAAIGADGGAVAAGAFIELKAEARPATAAKPAAVADDDEIGFGNGVLPPMVSSSREPPMVVLDEDDEIEMLPIESVSYGRADGRVTFESQGFAADATDSQDVTTSRPQQATSPRPAAPKHEAFSNTAPERPSLRRSVSRPTLSPISIGTPANGVDDLDATAPLIPIPEGAAPRLPERRSMPRSGVVVDQSADLEVGFDRDEPDHTMIDPSVVDAVRSLSVAPSVVAAVRSLSVAPSLLAPNVGAQPEVDLLRASRPLLNARRRSNNLPRPKLVRGPSGATDAGGPSVSNDLKTLDFFIDRGFYESAVALCAELEKRHPNSEELRVRRNRIAAMARR